MFLNTALALVFTVATYNVREDAKEDGPARSWSKRLPRVAEVIRKGRFDVVGFQEVSPAMLKTITAAFPEYEVVGYSDGKGPEPIAYRPELFKLIDSGRFSMSESPFDFCHASWNASGVRICEWLLLETKENGRRVRIFNVHPDWKSAMARARGMDMVLNRVRAAETFGEEVILVGDMNDQELVRYDNDRYDSKYPMGGSISRAKSVLRDAYDITKTPHAGPYMTATWYLPKASERLDYIFVSEGFQVLAHRTHDGRPDGDFPSDHDAVSAMLKLEDCR